MPPRNGMTRICEVCGASFYRPKSELHLLRCSMKCYLEGRWGPSHRETRKCLVCSFEFECYRSDGKVVCGRACDNERKSLTQNGANSVLWRGGFNMPYVGTWRRQRRLALERDGNRCVLCDSTDRPQVHHIVPARYGGPHDLDNLITLCRSCHSKEEMKVNAHYRATLLHGRPPRTDRGRAA